MSTKDMADFAEVEVELHVRIRVHADGSKEITRSRVHVMSPRLTRGNTKAEMKAEGVGQWEQGGVAILSPEHVKNGRQLYVQAGQAARRLEQQLKTAVEQEA